MKTKVIIIDEKHVGRMTQVALFTINNGETIYIEDEKFRQNSNFNFSKCSLETSFVVFPVITESNVKKYEHYLQADDGLVVEKKYQEPFTIYPTMIFLLNNNSLKILKDRKIIDLL